MARVAYDFYMTQAARALEIACDSRKRKSYRLNRPLQSCRMKCICKMVKANRSAGKTTEYSNYYLNEHTVGFIHKCIG